MSSNPNAARSSVFIETRLHFMMPCERPVPQDRSKGCAEQRTLAKAARRAYTRRLRAVSSVGQSALLTPRRSSVRAGYGPYSPAHTKRPLRTTERPLRLNDLMNAKTYDCVTPHSASLISVFEYSFVPLLCPLWTP